jgi:hypothetical protein
MRTLIDFSSLEPPPPPAPHPLSTRLLTAATAIAILPAVDLLVTVYLHISGVLGSLLIGAARLLCLLVEPA